MARDRQQESARRRQALGRAVRHLRQEADLSQEELGYRCDLDRTYVSGIERGVRNPTLDVIWRLAEGLDSTASELLRVAEEEAY